MANKFFNRRILALYLTLLVVLVGFLYLTRLEAFPCMDFVSDSEQGYYMGWCPLVDEDGVFLFGARGYYDSIPFIGSWISVALFLVLPYVGALLLSRFRRAK